MKIQSYNLSCVQFTTFTLSSNRGGYHPSLDRRPSANDRAAATDVLNNLNIVFSVAMNESNDSLGVLGQIKREPASASLVDDGTHMFDMRIQCVSLYHLQLYKVINLSAARTMHPGYTRCAIPAAVFPHKYLVTRQPSWSPPTRGRSHHR